MKNWRQELLMVLKDSNGQYVSGEELAVKFGVSRAALWKKISILRSEGYPIEATTNRGYRLMSKDREFESRIREVLVNENLDDIFDVHVTDSTPSTNLLARESGARGTGAGGGRKIGVFVALHQTAGRGRRGRTWISNTEDGLWFSFLLHPEMEPRTASMLTLLFGLCVLKAIQQVSGVQAGIKWPNDIISLQNGKKICGILSETSMEDNLISYAVVGCGINVSQDAFPEEIRSVATSLLMEGLKISKASLLAAVLQEVAVRYPEFEAKPSDFLSEYRANCATLGRSVRIESAVPDEGIAIDISSTGNLLVKTADGTILTCSAGEVSVRGMLGYV